MKRRICAAWIAALCGLAALTGCATLDRGGQSAVLRAKRRVAPAIVHVRPVKEVFDAGRRKEMLVMGSGFIISRDGYVVTNEHVAGQSTSVQCVLSDNREVQARVVGTDVETDIAVLKLETDSPLPSVRMGRSDRLEAGQSVLALGSPHGLARSVSLGIVSVPDRFLSDKSLMEAPYYNWIQTDAAINPGNSGGPLVNLRGEVVGVNARVLSGAENVGFAIPVDIVKDVVADIIENGHVRRGWLGIEFQEMLAKGDVTSEEGVIISDVDRLSPAAEAEIKPGDILTAVNGRKVHARYEEDLPGVRLRIASLPVGETATLTLLRGGEPLEVSLVAEEKTSLRGSQQAFEEWGFTASEVTTEVARRAQLQRRTGILVSGVDPGGRAAVAGLQQGDIVLQVDGEEIPTLTAFNAAYARLRDGKARLVMLFVQRGALTRFVLVNTTAEAAPAASEPGEDVSNER
ncbi:MAG TPA: trypsin-like peptidase domain-containing protein [Candidatus Hydrogenedentes bacterium]|nr:trypsin-like peptidase domain-containing protein [Candidatus Hydrogenedentota bacterium]